MNTYCLMKEKKLYLGIYLHAYRQGYKEALGYRKDLKVRLNPYDPSSKEWVSWYRGWNDVIGGLNINPEK